MNFVGVLPRGHSNTLQSAYRGGKVCPICLGKLLMPMVKVRNVSSHLSHGGGGVRW
jgi:hypothetical protein